MNQTLPTTHGLGLNIGKTALLYPVVFLVAMASGMANLGLIFFAKSVLGASPGQIGILVSIFNVFYVCGCYFFRHLSATLPPRYSIFAATFTSFFSIGMIFLLQSLFWSFVFFAFFGLAVSLFWPVMMGWLSSGLEGRRFGRVMGWFSFSWSLGSIISPVIAGCLEDMGNSFALRGGSFMFLVAAGLVVLGIFVIPELSHKTVAPPQQLEKNNHPESGTLLRYSAWFSAFASWFMIGTITTVVSLAAGSDLDITKKTVGIIFLVRSLTMSLAFVVMGQTSWWHFRGKQIAIGALIGVGASIFMAYTRSPVVIGFIMLIVGIIVGQSYTNSVFHGVSGLADKSWRMAIHEMIINAGVVFGSVSGGIVYGAFGITPAYLISAAIWMISLIAAGIVLTLMRKRVLAQNRLA
jgi:predicted MFS family arabinose efflux permease